MIIEKMLLREAFRGRLTTKQGKALEDWLDDASEESVLSILSFVSGIIEEDIDLAIVDGQAVRI